MRRFGALVLSSGLLLLAKADVCTDSSLTCDINAACALDSNQLSTGMRTFCMNPSTVSPCRDCKNRGQSCYNTGECQDSLFLCDYLTDAQKAALPSSHPCLNVACQLNKNSPQCSSQVYQFCCAPGTANCTNTGSTTCTPSGCSSFMTAQAGTVDYSRTVCPFANASYTCSNPECNNTFIYQDIVNTFAANQGCSGSQCITDFIPTVCQNGPNVTSTSTADKLACTNRIVDYCTNNPTDPGCTQVCPYSCNAQPNCPCRSADCAAVYQAPICVMKSGACANFKAAFKTEMFRQRFFQPKSSNLAYAKNNFGAPSGPFTWTDALNTSKTACNAVVAGLGDKIAACVQTSFSFCNANPWQAGCSNDLSTCGDGYVSWLESCDEGSIHATGGCDPKCRTAARWECYQQGTPCRRCIHETGYVVDGVNPSTKCPFCSGLISNFTWPCRSPNFTSAATNLTQAIASDNYAATYCNAIAANGTLIDPGCAKYVNQTRAFSLPTIANGCDYIIKNVTLNTPQLYSLRFAIFNCRFVDPLGQRADVTPKYYFQSPLDLLSSSTKAQLLTQSLAALNSLYNNRASKLYSLRDLQLSDFFPYVNPNLVGMNGGTISMSPPLADLSVFPNGANISSYDCGSSPFTQPLIALPPTGNPLQWALKATLMRLKYTAINNNDQSLSDFSSLSPDLFSVDTTPINSTLQFAYLISRSVKGANGNIQENPTSCFSSGSRSCTSIESAITNGMARIRLKNRLFDNFCDDTDSSCIYQVEKCRNVPLVPKAYNLDKNIVRTTASALVANIKQTSNAVSASDATQGFLQVAMTASNEVFSDTINLFWSAVTTGTQPKILKNVANYCSFPKYNPDGSMNSSWLSNPCCNNALSDFMCCMPRNVPSGSISVITGIKSSVVNTFCPLNPDTMLSFLNGAYVGLTTAQNRVNALDNSASVNALSTVGDIQAQCSASILNATSLQCQTDADCNICSQSKCQVNPVTLVGTCSVPWDNIIGCTIECLSTNMDPLLLRYLKDDWNLTSANSAQDFTNAFIRVATDVDCTGPLANTPDIGKKRSIYTCNSSCAIANICDDVEYQIYLRNSLNNQDLDFSKASTCVSYNGTRVCDSFEDNGACKTYTCKFDFIQSACKDRNSCMNKCQLPLTQGGCGTVNGTWYSDGSGAGRCCPPDARFIAAAGSSPALCTYKLPNTPALAYQITDPTCCAANNGTWFMTDATNGQCCFGRIITIQNSGVDQLACQTTITGWDVARCLSSCASYQQSCNTCKATSASGVCCSYETVSANQTACLAKQACSNNLLSPSNCNDPTPFCSKCTGNSCKSVTQSPTCLIDASKASDCVTAGGTWNSNLRQCAAVSGSSISASDCFRTDLCPSTTNMSAFYSIVPRYPRRSTRCLSGCYLPSVTQSACVANSKYMWDSTHGNGNGICVGRRNVVKTASACSSENGVFLNATRTFFPGAFTTQEQCSQGGCMGAPFTDGWNTSQCLNLTFGTCSAQCSSCASRTSPFSLQNSSGCFSADASYCSSVNASTTPCLVVDATTSSACLALTSTAWQSCNQYIASNTCTNASDLIASTLNCTWSTQQCPTQSQCVAQGTCNDQDNMRMQCLDSGWTYGDTCSVNFAVSFTDGNNFTRTSMKTAVCNTCNRINGVCVAPVDPMSPCNSALSHPMGCRVSGVTDATSCFLQGGTWYTRATTQADCLAIKACKEPGVSHISHKNATECAKCNGVPKSLYTWTPGQWKGPYVESYVWNPNGAQLSSVNQWRTTISDTKLAAALARPIARRKSNIEAQKALLMYNAMSDVLATLACACGSGASTACFNSTTTGTLVAETTVFCGLNSTIDTGFASAVVSNACPAPVPSSRRRLAVSSPDTSTVAWTVYPLASFTMFPLSPVCGSSELSPLVVTSAQGVVYGQLLGPGQGFNVTSGQATSVQLCLSLSANVHNWSSLFDTVDIASYQGGVFTPLNLLSFLPSTSDQLCFAPTQNGTYFPIQRASAAAATTSSCSPACATNSSICVYNMTAQSAQCLCRCGFTGSTCGASCLNQCSYQGMCSNNVCTCNSGYTGDDCSILVTPAPTTTPSTVPTPTTSSGSTVTTPTPTNVPTVSADPATPSPTPTKSPGDTMHLSLLVVVMSSILLVGLL